MKKYKTMIAAVVLVLVLLVGGAIAFFTDTKTTTNVFTIGNITISLTEPNWVAADALNKMPGDTIAKDPTITNTSANNPAYVFAKVEVPCSTDASPIELFTYTPNTAWYEFNTVACTGGKATHYYGYGSNTAMTSLTAGTSAPALFTIVTVNPAITGNETGLTGNLNMVVTGYGIQTTGLSGTSPSAVWTDAQFS